MDVECIPIAGSGPSPRFIIYRPLARLAFVGNRAMADLALAVAGGVIPTGPTEALDFLRSIGFLDPDPIPPASRAGDFRPSTAVLLLTNQCQLRCTYCYAAAGALARQQLSVELGLAAIDYVAENVRASGLPRFELSFHGGGEPTLAWKTLQACTAYARQKPVPAHVTLVSNGIWSRAQYSWIAGNLDGLSLSIDGDPATQNRQRPFASGRGSSAQVMRTIAELDRHAFPYGMRLTATAPWGNLPDQIDFLCQNTGCESMQVEPAFNEARGGHGRPTDGEALAFAAAFLEAFDVASKAGRRLYCSGARLGVVSPSFCTAPYGALVVNALGEVVSCYEVSGVSHPLWGISVLGRIAGDRVVIDSAARSRLHALIAARRDSCRDCYCYWTCAGDCYTRTFMPGPEGHLLHGGRCEANRYITQHMLLRGIALGGGVWRGSRGLAAGIRSLPVADPESGD